MEGGLSVNSLGLVLLVACIVAMVSRAMRLPYSVGLVAAGILLAFLPFRFAETPSPDWFYSMLLPPLIFEAALQIKWQPFRRELPVLLTLAFGGTMLAAALVGFGMHWLVGWGWIAALTFGFLIAATDPVAVIAAFRELRVEPRLSLLVEAESLLNDGAAAVGFSLVIALAGTAPLGPAALVLLMVIKLFGSILIGGAVAGGLLLLTSRTQDHLVEITLTTIIAYAAFLIAERVHASGVLAALAAGMVVGNLGWRGFISQAGRGHVLAFWDFAAFLANSVVFILIGLQEAHQAFSLLTLTAAIAIVLVLFSRAATVLLLCLPFRRTRLAVDPRQQFVLVWGGLRGALGLALALTIPTAVKERDGIVLAAFAVVAFSIFVQGLSMPPLIQRLRVRRGSAGEQR
jgi:CPA1 family monovalent cation:H+ antiporter